MVWTGREPIQAACIEHIPKVAMDMNDAGQYETKYDVSLGSSIEHGTYDQPLSYATLHTP